MPQLVKQQLSIYLIEMLLMIRMKVCMNEIWQKKKNVQKKMNQQKQEIGFCYNTRFF